MINVTKRIDEIESTVTEEMTPELFSELVELRNVLAEQDSKGGPATEHHNIRKSVSRSKP